jgi:pre-60S factor REI1
MTQLPALSAEQFEATAKTDELSRADHDNTSCHENQDPSPVSSPEAESEDEAEAEDESGDVDDRMKDTIDNSSRCLFCNLVSPTIEVNILHMHTGHGLFIPDSDKLLDLGTFLGYLASIIFTYNTCLYCNTERGSVEGIQTHMRDKGHCVINLDADSELLEFWDFGDSDEEGDDVVAKMAAVKLRFRNAPPIRCYHKLSLRYRTASRQASTHPVETEGFAI